MNVVIKDRKGNVVKEILVKDELEARKHLLLRTILEVSYSGGSIEVRKI